MLFSSLVFLFHFLPLLIGIYFISLKSWKNLVLLVFSLLFYAWGGFSYTFILIASILLNHFISLKLNKEKANKKWLFLGIGLNVTTLIIFKYVNFFIQNTNELFLLVSEFQIPSVKVQMPLGISFFTFQQMSMLWDVYRLEEKKKLKLLDSALYVSFFPQLIAGPIVRYHDIIDQIQNRTSSIELINSGIKRFIIGLFKKIVIANTCALIADEIIKTPVSNLSIDQAWLFTIAYALQIFFDFSGYSDMAIGLGRIFGFRILENFNFPYISRSIQEFWRRWHISLSNWFKDYVYIPLGGNRKGKSRTYFNLFLVFLLTGFWHGATWSFIFWGFFHGVFLIIERIGFGRILNRIPSFFSWIYTMLIVLIGWVFFRVEHFQDALILVSKLFSFSSYNGKIFMFANHFNLTIFIIAILLCTPIIEKWIALRLNSIQNIFPIQAVPNLVASIFYIGLLFVSSVILATSSYNPFIYFRF